MPTELNATIGILLVIGIAIFCIIIPKILNRNKSNSITSTAKEKQNE